jgi:hypothetical protein
VAGGVVVVCGPSFSPGVVGNAVHRRGCVDHVGDVAAPVAGANFSPSLGIHLRAVLGAYCSGFIY